MGSVMSRSTKKRLNFMSAADMSAEDMFWYYMQRPSTTACWRWEGMHARGIPIYNGRTKAFRGAAKRIAWDLVFPQQPIQASQTPIRDCKTPNCCNPHHHKVGVRGSQPRSFTLSDFLKKLSANTAIAGPSECWEFTGRRTQGNYGSVKLGNTSMLAHRLAYMAHKGDIPAGMLVRHTCDNPPCVNPRHLLTGTDADNSRDKILRNRAGALHHARHNRSKLTWPQVRTIRRQYMAGATIRALAKRFEVSDTSITILLKGNTWFPVVGNQRLFKGQDHLLLAEAAKAFYKRHRPRPRNKSA